MTADTPSALREKAISAVVEAVDPRLLVHGHYHHRYSAKTGRTQVEGLGRDGDGPQSWIVVEPAMWAVKSETSAA